MLLCSTLPTRLPTMDPSTSPTRFPTLTPSQRPSMVRILFKYLEGRDVMKCGLIASMIPFARHQRIDHQWRQPWIPAWPPRGCPPRYVAFPP
jgi:hypothetical protein